MSEDTRKQRRRAWAVEALDSADDVLDRWRNAADRGADAAWRGLLASADWLGDRATDLWDWAVDHPEVAFALAGLATGGPTGAYIGWRAGQALDEGASPLEVASAALAAQLDLIALAGVLTLNPALAGAAGSASAALRALEAGDTRLAAAYVEQTASQVPPGALEEALASAGLDVETITPEEIDRLADLGAALAEEDPDTASRRLAEEIASGYGPEGPPPMGGAPPLPGWWPDRDAHAAGDPLGSRPPVWSLPPAPGPRGAGDGDGTVYL